MVDDLAERPTSGTIRLVQLVAAQTVHGVAQIGGPSFQFRDPGAAFGTAVVAGGVNGPKG